MKKALVALLILAVAGGVFAQEVTFGGAVKTGVTIAIPSADGADPYVQLWNDDAGPAYLELNGAFSLENYGLKFRLKNAYEDGDADALSGFAFLYANFLNDILTLSAGRIDGNAWGTPGDYDTGIDGVTGLRLEIKPIEGLNFGFALKAPPKTDSYEIGQFFLETVIGVKYSHDLFTAALAVELDSDADVVRETVTTPTDDEIKIIFGVDIKAVPNLTAAIDGGITDLGDFSNFGIFEIHEKFAYAISDPLNVGITLVQKFAGADQSSLADDQKLYLKFDPWVSYKIIDPLTAQLDVILEDDFTGFEALNISIKPKLTYALGEKAEIAGWWQSTFTTGDVDPVTPHKLQVNFAWSF